MNQTTLDIAFGILLANIIPLVVIVFVVAVVVFGWYAFDYLQDKFFRKNK